MQGQFFELVAYKNAWGENRVYFYNPEQVLIALAADWTDVVPVHPFVAVAAGRSLFRAEDLLNLAGLLRELSSRGAGRV